MSQTDFVNAQKSESSEVTCHSGTTELGRSSMRWLVHVQNSWAKSAPSPDADNIFEISNSIAACQFHCLGFCLCRYATIFCINYLLLIKARGHLFTECKSADIFCVWLLNVGKGSHWRRMCLNLMANNDVFVQGSHSEGPECGFANS